MRKLRTKRKVNNKGISLIETMTAVYIALFSVFGMGALIAQVAATTKNQGTEATQATIFAQDKMENLLALNFVNCNVPAASQATSCNTTGISAPSWTQGLLAGGGTAPEQTECPDTGLMPGYVDYLDQNGLPITGTSCDAVSTSSVAYIRQWQITDLPSTGKPMKQITVAVYSKNTTSKLGGSQIIILTSVLSN